MKGGLLGTVAPPYAHLTLLLEIAMGVGLLIGAWLARRRRFRQHAWCQSAIVLLNLAVIVLVMMPSFQVQVVKTCQDILRSGDGTRGARNDYRNRGTVHLACRGHERLAGEIPHHQIQGLDANRIGTLVGSRSCWDWQPTHAGTPRVSFGNEIAGLEIKSQLIVESQFPRIFRDFS
jgi:uncharacterized protein (TIGR03382 family)